LRVLLDTHTLLWSVNKPALLSSQAAEIVADERNVIFVSAASAWEISTKVRLGKLPGAVTIERSFVATMDLAGYTLVAIEGSVAIRAGRLTAPHRDPFDRIIAAQALTYDIPILSVDARLDTFGVQRIW
jgi:PIN domain nuclease of toxin-antitoxin system